MLRFRRHSGPGRTRSCHIDVKSADRRKPGEWTRRLTDDESTQPPAPAPTSPGPGGPRGCVMRKAIVMVVGLAVFTGASIGGYLGAVAPACAEGPTLDALMSELLRPETASREAALREIVRRGERRAIPGLIDILRFDLILDSSVADALACTNPRHISAAYATYPVPDDLVLGIVGRGEARAYPLRIMGWPEMANEVV